MRLGVLACQVMKGHVGAVVQMDFSADSKYLRTVSCFYELMFWEVKSGIRVSHTAVVPSVVDMPHRRVMCDV
jgi:hypothetical protein